MGIKLQGSLDLPILRCGFMFGHIALQKLFCHEKYFLNTEVFSIKFIYFEKATKFCKIFTTVKSKVKNLQNFVALTEYTNFNIKSKKKSEGKKL